MRLIIGVEPQPVDPLSDDPDFKSKVRMLHIIIKHCTSSNNETEHYPPSLLKPGQHLTEVMVPAFPSQPISDLIAGKAKNWTFTKRPVPTLFRLGGSGLIWITEKRLQSPI